MTLQLKPLLRKAVDTLDLGVAALGCLLAIPLTVYVHMAIGSPVYTTAGVLGFSACLAYLVLSRRLSASIRSQATASRRMSLLTDILFFALLVYSLAALYLRPELYTRPMGYFVAIAVMASILAIEVLLLPARRYAAHFTLFKIMIISLSLGWSQLLIYPSIVGVDPWYHQMFTLQMLETGHVSVGYLYSDLPGMHLLIGATSLVTDLNYKISTMLSVSLLQVVCTILFVFLLGKLVHTTRAGLLAALALGVASWHIRYAFWTIPNSMALAFIPVIVYLLLELRREHPRVSVCLAILLTGVLLLTHTIATGMLVLVLFSIWLGSEIYRRLRYPDAERSNLFIVIALVVTGAGLVYWALFAEHIMRDITRLGGTLGAQLVALFVPGVSPPPAEIPPLQLAVAHYQNVVVPLGERLLNQLGFFLFCSLGIIGSLAMLSRSLRNRYGFALVTAGFVVLAVGVLIVLPFRSDLIGRFNYLAQVLLALPLGTALLWLGSLPARRIAGACLVAICVFTLTFLMVMSPEANLDNRSLSPNTIVRYAFTESELQAMKTGATIHDGKIATDRNYRDLEYLPALNTQLSSICAQLRGEDFTSIADTLVLIRKEIVVNPLKLGRWAPFRLDYDPAVTLEVQGFSRVYECGSVSAFMKS